MGVSDNLTPAGWQEFLAQEGTPSAEVLLNPETAAELMKTLEGSGIGNQMIMSQIMMADPMSAEPTAAASLESIAIKELAGEPRSPDETEFIKTLVVEDGMCGAPPVAGWYTKLFYDATDTDFVFDPTVADVHTDPNAGEVLHVGTGYANLMVMVVDTTCGKRAYAGPASSYYEQIEGNFVRFTDEDWVKQFELAPPVRPEWTDGFVL